jgi:urea transporter
MGQFFLRCIHATLRGIGQVMLQENAMTGLCFLVGITFDSLWMALGTVLGALVSTVTAMILGWSPKEILAGIYGFNGALVGVAGFFFLRPRLQTAVLVVAFSIAAVFLTYLFRRYLSFPTYTAPFVLSAWCMLALGRTLSAVSAMHELPAHPLLYFVAIPKGVGQVMFQGTSTAGILFIIGVFFSSRRQGFFVVLGSLTGMAVALLMHAPATLILAGLFGYNAALAAIAVDLAGRHWVFCLVAAALSTPLMVIFPKIGLAALTAPFVLATWAVLVLSAGTRHSRSAARNVEG